VVWSRVRSVSHSCIILVIVLCLHLLFMCVCTWYGMPIWPVVVPPVGAEYTYVDVAPASQAMPAPVVPEPEPAEEPEKIDHTPFASLYEKIEPKKSSESPKRDLRQSIETDNDTGELTINKEKEEDRVAPEVNENENPSPVSRARPKDVAIDDLPFPFEGVHTTALTERDNAFHAFIKAVNKALYASMQQMPCPLTAHPQPIAVRMAIVRTGRLAQTPTVIRSSGSTVRDQWYVDMIKRAAQAFPPIPPSIHIPFMELVFREDMQRATPQR